MTKRLAVIALSASFAAAALAGPASAGKKDQPVQGTPTTAAVGNSNPNAGLAGRFRI